MLTFEEWRHTYADIFETDDAARAAWTAASNKGYSVGVQDTRELLAAHNAGAQEPVAWRYQSEDPLDGGEWLLSDTKPNRRNIQPLYAHPQPMPQTDAARDVLALRSVAERAQRLMRGATWNLGGLLSAESKARDIPSKAISTVKSRHLASLRDALAEIERLDRAKGE